MLNNLILSIVVFSQLPMDKIRQDPPAKPTVIVQEKVVYKTTNIYVYVYTDKFGIEHTGLDREKARREVVEANKKPFIMKDSSGEVWYHQNRSTLEEWIKSRNKWLAQPAKPVSQVRPVALPVYNYASVQTQIYSLPPATLNCGPVG